MKEKYGLLSLFSGAGGLDLGFKNNGGFNLLLANDIRKPPSMTYSQNFDHKITNLDELNQLKLNLPSFILGDIQKIDFEKYKKDDFDIIIGGPPCQDFSIVRGPSKERRGIEVKRGQLYAHFIRALIHLQPKVFVFENVPGLKSANKGAAYKTIIDDFSHLNIKWNEIGRMIGNGMSRSLNNYSIAFSGIIDSADLGVPQRRKRLIIIGAREDLVPKEFGLWGQTKQRAEELLYGTKSLFKKYPLSTIEAFEGLPLPELNEEYNKIMKDYGKIFEQVQTDRVEKWKREVFDNLSFDCVTDYLALNGLTTTRKDELEEAFKEHARVLKKVGYYNNRIEGKSFYDGSNQEADESEAVFKRLQMIPPDENHEFVRDTEWEVEGRGMSLIYRRLHPLKPSYTVVAFGGGGTWGYHYRRNRARLTNRERARLQTFPDSFNFKGNVTEVRAQIGEAVPPILGEKIAEVTKLILSNLH